jgi:hypothetical protein
MEILYSDTGVLLGMVHILFAVFHPAGVQRDGSGSTRTC